MGVDLAKYKEYFNFKMAALAGALMGTSVFVSQVLNGPSLALVAASKQFVYTFFMGALLIAIVENMVITYQHRKYPAFYGVMSAWALTSLLSVVLHNLKGTPDPQNAILLNILLAPPGLIFIALKKKKELRKSS